MTTPSGWTQNTGLPSRLLPGGLFGGAFDDVALQEEDDAFVLTVEMPGFEREDISVAWDDGQLNIAAEHVDETLSQKRTYHRTFRLPKEVEVSDISATYRNGVLNVRLPIPVDAVSRGTPIDVEG
jgi:HSP20 family protein